MDEFDKMFEQEEIIKDKVYPVKEGYIAYKGLSKDMVAVNGQSRLKYEVGQIYEILPSEKPLKCCTNTGYHYCDTLTKVFNYYRNESGNRFFKIEVLGEYSKDGDKCITRKFKLIEEITKDQIEAVIKDSLFDDVLESVRNIQTKYPLCHVGGSVGLYLHGAFLKRWKDNQMDLDLVLPFYIHFEKCDNLDVEAIYKASGNDFDYTVILEGRKADIKIDPKQKYEIITHKGFKYKVSSVETIIEAKCRYALNGQMKHINDIKELIKQR